MELTGTIKALDIDFVSGKPKLTLEINEKNDALQGYNDLKDCEKLSLRISRYREKRSLNSNNYCWCIIGKIADAVTANKEDIYFQMLKKYGQSEMISVLAQVKISKYIRYFEEAGESKLSGKSFKHYKIYKGSSEYDSKEMAVFIEGVVSEAKDLGIQTLPPEEIERLKSLWDN